MIRPDSILHDLDPCEWSAEEVLGHLRHTFDLACRDFPDIMEPYAIRLADSLSDPEIKALMREALRSTFKERWPNPFLKGTQP